MNVCILPGRAATDGPHAEPTRKGAADMMWGVLVVVVAVIAIGCAVPFVVIRFNQLSLGRSLCEEARRQFDAARSTRRGVMSVFLSEVARTLGASHPAVTALEAAVATASQAGGRVEAGAAEHAVTDATRAVAVALHEAGPAASDGAGAAGAPAASDGPAVTDGADGLAGRGGSWASDLYAQLEGHETHISAAVRHHNASVRSYMRRRRGPLSLPLRGTYGPLPLIDYEPSTVVPAPVDGTPSPDAEEYRPGRVAEDL